MLHRFRHVCRTRYVSDTAIHHFSKNSDTTYTSSSDFFSQRTTWKFYNLAQQPTMPRLTTLTLPHQFLLLLPQLTPTPRTLAMTPPPPPLSICPARTDRHHFLHLSHAPWVAAAPSLSPASQLQVGRSGSRPLLAGQRRRRIDPRSG